MHTLLCAVPMRAQSSNIFHVYRRIAKQVEVHYSAAQSTPKSDALQRNIGRTIPVRLRVTLFS